MTKVNNMRDLYIISYIHPDDVYRTKSRTVSYEENAKKTLKELEDQGFVIKGVRNGVGEKVDIGQKEYKKPETPSVKDNITVLYERPYARRFHQRCVNPYMAMKTVKGIEAAKELIKELEAAGHKVKCVINGLGQKINFDSSESLSKPTLDDVIKTCSEMSKNGKRDAAEKGTIDREAR